MPSFNSGWPGLGLPRFTGEEKPVIPTCLRAVLVVQFAVTPERPPALAGAVLGPRPQESEEASWTPGACRARGGKGAGVGPLSSPGRASSSLSASVELILLVNVQGGHLFQQPWVLHL